jgi:4-hydroxymandelate oxidase
MPALWYQVYLVKAHQISLACAQEAVGASFEAAVVTVDTPYLGHRTRDLARGFTPVDLNVARAVVPAELSDSLDEREWVHAMTQRDDLRLEDLVSFQESLGVPVIAKGVLRGGDHSTLVGGGIGGTWFSNHGGRQVDGAIAPIDALRRLDRSEISQGACVLDGGVRRARDVIVGLASGASVIGVGRHAAWAFAIGGPVALASFLIELRSEIRNLLGLLGTPTLAELDRTFVSSVVTWQ